MKLITPILAAFYIVALTLSSASIAAAAETNATIRVLFLGDRAGHRPTNRFAIIEPVLARKNIEMTYTEAMTDLNPSRLAAVDVLLIYANITRISPEQEKAMMDFVSAGGGLVPIHCATYCFHNSSNYIELVGAQFRRHGDGVFKDTIVNPNHPVMQGLSEIESWDETYVHHRHNTNRIVLAERRDNEGAEPWTWVRTHNKGRVFYTAWGHDQRTWNNAGFQALVENGIRWASANSPGLMKPKTGLKPLEYEPSETPLPNYLPGRGGQGQIQTVQKALEPAESMKRMVTLPGFNLSMFTSEPDIVKPVWLAWDTRGRLWIAETVDYPNELQPENAGRDRLKILEDTNGDGKADKFTIFADKLSIPTGFVFANGGVIVIHSGRTEFFRDKNGDDKADERKVLFTGWSMRDTHATASNLRYGFDGWIWGTVGYSGFEGTVGGKQIRFGQGVFRFKPDGSAMEFVRSSNNNTWGLGVTEDNLIFGSTANNNASMYMPIANRYYEKVRGWSAARMETIADSQRIYPLTDKVRQVDAHGRFTAGAGSAIYTARQFPKHYWNRYQFVSEPTGHYLGQFFLDAHGTDYVARNARGFLASDDEWTAPICAEVGPDGALWVVDWYNIIVQHNPTPRGFKTGKGAAYESPLRDKVRGRIYRVAHNTAPAKTRREIVNILDLPANVTASTLNLRAAQKLVSVLKNDNMLWRMHAQRLLVERGQKDVVPALLELVRDQSVDAIGLNPAAIHALWTLKGLGALESPTMADIMPDRIFGQSNRRNASSSSARAGEDAASVTTAALKHPSAGVRRAAVMVLPRNAAGVDAILSASLLNDSDPQVRMAALLALTEMNPSDEAGAAVFAMLQDEKNVQDRWISDAAVAAGSRHDEGFIKAVSKASSIGNTERIVQLVAAHYAARPPKDSIVATITSLSSASPTAVTAILEGLISGWPEEAATTVTQPQKDSLTQAMKAIPENSHDRLLALAQRMGQPQLFGASIPEIVQTLKNRVVDSKLSDTERAAAARRLVSLEDTPENWKLVLDQVTLIAPPELAIGLVNALSESRDGRARTRAADEDRGGQGRRGGRTSPTAEALLGAWKQFTPAVRRSALGVLMRRPEWTGTLLQAVADGNISRNDLAPEHWSQLRQNPNQFIARRAEQLGQSVATTTSGREEVLAKLLPLAKEKGDIAQGKKVFTANCAVCHVFGAEGKNIGPDLNGIAARDRADILAEILDPNRSVEANYRSWTVETKDGLTYSGKLDSESQTAIELTDATAQKHVIQRKDIAELTQSALSLMPAGFESLKPEELTGLLEYLTSVKSH
jgi:putative membrane-bound dehydrogenase-like protein